MIINPGLAGNYSSSLAAASRNDGSIKDETAAPKANLLGEIFKTPTVASAGETKAASSPSQEAIKELQEQIKEAQKLLQEQQQQLAAVQSSKLPEQEKAAQVMAIQQQIAGTMARLGALTASLLELMKGTVNTTA